MSENVSALFTPTEIEQRLGQLAAKIATELPADVTVVGLLKGAVMLSADLARALDAQGMRPYLEFLQVSSYGLEKESSGRVKVIGGMPNSVSGKQVLLVDDIQDTGRTLKFTTELLRDNGAARVWTLALLDKPSRRQVEFEADYIGFTIPDVFVVGYGIDYAERYRHLPFIGQVS